MVLDVHSTCQELIDSADLRHPPLHPHHQDWIPVEPFPLVQHVPAAKAKQGRLSKYTRSNSVLAGNVLVSEQAVATPLSFSSVLTSKKNDNSCADKFVFVFLFVLKHTAIGRFHIVVLLSVTNCDMTKLACMLCVCIICAD